MQSRAITLARAVQPGAKKLNSQLILKKISNIKFFLETTKVCSYVRI